MSLWVAAITLACLTLPALALDMPAIGGEKQRQPADNAALTGDHETIAAPLPDPDAAKPANRLGWEWFGVKLGLPLLWIDDGLYRRVYYVFDILFPTYRWKYAYLTTLELHLRFVYGDVGLAVGGGFRIPLGASKKYEMRLGAAFGYRSLNYDVETLGDYSLVPAPHGEFIANFQRFNIGFGLEIPIYCHLSDSPGRNDDEGQYNKYNDASDSMVQIQLLFYMRVSVL